MAFPALLNAKASSLSKDSFLIIEVIYNFNEEKYNTDWVFKSMQPNIIIDQTSFEPETNKILFNSFTSNKLQFKIPYNKWKKHYSDFIDFSYGKKIVQFHKRPISNFVYKGRYRYSKMPTIKFINLSSPNWLIFKESNWIIDDKNTVMLDISIYNPLAIDYPGVNIDLEMSNYVNQCASYGNSEYIIPVEIQINQGEISLFSEDKVIKQKVKRDVKVSQGACNEKDIILNLGKTKLLGAESLTRIVFTFEKKLKRSSRVIEFEGFFGNIEIKSDIIFPNSYSCGDDVFEDFFGDILKRIKNK